LAQSGSLLRFLTMVRVLLGEVLQVRQDLIGPQLAHAVRDPNEWAYNRTTHLDDAMDAGVGRLFGWYLTE
jgi:hypothetical protein